MPVERPWDKPGPSETPAPSEKEFLAGQRRRFGQTNPELIKEPLWDYMVKARRDPYGLREYYDFDQELIGYRAHDMKEINAIWSFDRIGMTTTVYKKDFLIHIGGEHDDSCDPDFLIFNEVIVEDRSGNVWIYGYPRPAFPPTDFHTATLLSSEGWKPYARISLDEGILILGGLGYPEDREFWETPVYHLSFEEMSILKVKTSGDGPGWIHKHGAALSENNLLVTGGLILDDKGVFHQNPFNYSLDLQSLRWTKL